MSPVRPVYSPFRRQITPSRPLTAIAKPEMTRDGSPAFLSLSNKKPSAAKLKLNNVVQDNACRIGDMRCNINKAAETVVNIRAHRFVPQSAIDAAGQVMQMSRLNQHLLTSESLGAAMLLASTEENDDAEATTQDPQALRKVAWSGSGVIVSSRTIHHTLAKNAYMKKELEAAYQVILKKKKTPYTYLVLTNNHVAEGAERTTITLSDGTELRGYQLKSPYNGAEVRCPITDAACFVIVSNRALPTAKLAHYSTLHKLQNMDPIVVAGHPLGLPNIVVTEGIISERTQLTGTHPYPVFQFDAALSPGNSGGPLFNVDAVVIGLNTFTLLRAQNTNFAIPIILMLLGLQNVYSKGSPQWSMVPASWATFDLDLRDDTGFTGQVSDRDNVHRGAIVADLDESSGSGLQPNDVVVSMRAVSGPNGKPLTKKLKSQFPWLNQSWKVTLNVQQQISDLMGRSLPLQPGSTIALKVYRPTVATNEAGAKYFLWGESQEILMQTQRMPTAQESGNPLAGDKEGMDQATAVRLAAEYANSIFAYRRLLTTQQLSASEMLIKAVARAGNGFGAGASS